MLAFESWISEKQMEEFVLFKTQLNEEDLERRELLTKLSGFNEIESITLPHTLVLIRTTVLRDFSEEKSGQAYVPLKDKL